MTTRQRRTRFITVGAAALMLVGAMPVMAQDESPAPRGSRSFSMA